MALGTFIAGRYSATYDPPGAPAAADMGITEEGWEIQIAHSKELIQGTDAYGDMVIDGIWRGLNVHLQGNSIEWKAGILNALLPYQTYAPTGATFLGPGAIGRLDSDIAGTIILSSTTGTPAVATPASITATYAIIAENFDVRYLLNSKLRRSPGRWRLLPYSDAGTIKILTAT